MSDLDEIRRQKKNKFATILILVSGVGMLFIGLPNYFAPDAQQIMTVNGQAVSAELYQNARQQLQRQNPHASEQDLKTAAIRSTLQRVVLEQHALQSGFTLPDAALYALVKNQFGDNDGYRQALKNMQTSAQSYEQHLRQSEAYKHYYNTFSSLNILSAEQLQSWVKALMQERFYRLATLKLSDFEVAEPEMGQLEQYYQQHQERYQSPAAAEVEYLHFHQEALPPVKISEDFLKEALQTAGKRAAKYVLFPENQRQEALAWRTQLMAGEKNWEQLEQAIAAKTLDAEVGDFELQGFGHTDIPEINKALFALTEKGEWSPLTESAYGLMLLQLSALELPSLEEVQQQQTQMAQEKALYALSGRVLELLGEGNWGEMVKLLPAQEAKITRIEAGQKHELAILNHDELTKALFVEKVNVGSIADPVTEADGSFVVLRPRAYFAAEALPFATVQERVRQDYIAEQQKNQLEAKIAAIRTDIPNLKGDELAQKHGLRLVDLPWLSRHGSASLSRSQTEALFASGEALQVQTQGDESRLFFLSGVRESQLDADFARFAELQLKGLLQEEQLEALADYLSKRANVKLSHRLSEEP